MIDRNDNEFSVFVSEFYPIKKVITYCKKRLSVKKFCPDAHLRHSDGYPVTVDSFLYYVVLRDIELYSAPVPLSISIPGRICIMNLRVKKRDQLSPFF